MKAAMIGTWHVHTEEYANAIINNPKSELVAVWDSNPERGRAFAEKHGIPFTSDYNEILQNKEIDSVAICTATNEHPEVITKAAKAGKNIFTEKVLAFTTREAKDICAAIDGEGGKFTISFPHLTFPKLRFAKELLESGKLGEITYARVRNVHNGATAGWLPPHFYDKVQCGGGAMMDLGAHPMYTLHWLLGEPQSIVSTFTSVTGKAVEDNAVSVITFKNGAIGVSETGFVSEDNPYTLELSGTQGALMIHGDEVRYCSTDTDHKWVTAETLPQEMPLPVHQWIDAVADGTPAPFGTKEAYSLTQFMEGAYLALEKKYNF
ncbi:MAG: Gfo/Idh/MocA family oxidoreductase [Oscillospiraceae bacterium]